MAKIFRDSSVLNQFGTPSINSNTIANRPAFGQTGRLFVSTDTLSIYRDTGSAWDNLTSGGGSQNLEQVTTVGNQTTQGINIINSGIKGLLISSTIADLPTTYNFALYSVGFSVLKSTYNISNSNTNVASILQNNINVDASTSYNAFFNANFSNLDLKIPSGSTLTLGTSANNGSILALNSFSGSGGGSLVNSQAGGNGFRAISPIISKTNYTITNNITIDKYAGMVLYGAEGISSSGKLVITDYYTLLINPSDYFTNSPTVSNRWGIYQAGALDYNYFSASLTIGSNIADFGSYKLNVSGNANITGYINTNTLFATTTATNEIKPQYPSPVLSIKSTGGASSLTLYDSSGDIFIGTAPTITTRKLTLRGEQEFLVTVGTGTYTASGNHLPLWVNGVQYWLALLNPPALP